MFYNRINYLVSLNPDIHNYDKYILESIKWSNKKYFKVYYDN